MLRDWLSDCLKRVIKCLDQRCFHNRPTTSMAFQSMVFVIDAIRWATGPINCRQSARSGWATKSLKRHKPLLYHRLLFIVSAIQRHMPRGLEAVHHSLPAASDSDPITAPHRLTPPTVPQPGTAGSPDYSPAPAGGKPSRPSRRASFAVARSCRSSWRYRRIASG